MNYTRALQALTVGGIDFNARLKEIYTTFPDKKEETTTYVESLLREASDNIGKKVSEINVRVQLVDTIDLLPLAYIARNYFHKSKSWLYQRINGHTVNGKPATFTPEEMETFNAALKDICHKIGSITIV